MNQAQRKQQALLMLSSEKHPFCRQHTPEVRMTRSTVTRATRDLPVNSPLVQNLLRQCSHLEDLLKKSRNIIEEKDQKIQLLMQLLREREQCSKELQAQNHKLLEERQILIEHITQLEQEDDQDSQQEQEQPTTNLPSWRQHRHLLNQIRLSTEELPIFLDIDNLTYEQLLELEDHIGYVNRGLSHSAIAKIPEIPYYQRQKDAQICSICQADFEQNDRCRELPCLHLYHSKCIEIWLSKEKKCPICNQELEVD